jgi:hypothetical protein
MEEPVMRAGWRRAAAVTVCLLTSSGVARADEIEQLRRDLEGVKRQMREMQSTIRRQDELIQKLEAERAKAPAAGPPSAALDRAVEAAKAEAPPSAAPVVPPTAILTRSLGGAQLRLVDVSVDILTAVGASTERDEEIANLQGGAHDPNRRGFTLQQAEFSFSGAVDPYFTGEAHFVLTDSSTELEEAFLTTQSLPYGLQVEAGHFFTEFGRINPTHPHAWRWIDQPVINSRLFGGDGLRNPGMRLGWLVPVPWFSQLHLGAQNASGETAFSFLGEGGGEAGHGHEHGEEEEEEEATGIGGRPLVERDVHRLEDLLYLARWENAWTLTDSLSALVGGSGLFGPNASGAREQTRIYGADLVAKWRPATNFRGWPFLIWESEIMKRDFEAGKIVDEAGIVTVPEDTLYDWGLYTQLLYGFRYRWAGGVRYEYATGSGESVGGRAGDPLRDDRHRFSPLLSFQPTEFSRLRLQYNFDHAEHLDDDAHSVWLGVEILYGQHPAHRY